MPTIIRRLANYRHQLPVRWSTVAVLAIVIAYADGFLLTALQGTIGAIERSEPPFTRWLRDSTLLLPLVGLAVLAALLVARRASARSPHALVKLGSVLLLLTLVSGGVGMANAAVSSLRDYQYQAQHLELMHSYGGGVAQPGAVTLVDLGTAAPLSYALYCNLSGAAADNAVTLMEYATFMVHVRALVLISGLLLLTNLVIVTIVLALLHDRLWTPPLVANSQPNEAAGQLATGGTLI
jgi:hypothetical protein